MVLVISRSFLHNNLGSIPCVCSWAEIWRSQSDSKGFSLDIRVFAPSANSVFTPGAELSSDYTLPFPRKNGQPFSSQLPLNKVFVVFLLLFLLLFFCSCFDNADLEESWKLGLRLCFYIWRSGLYGMELGGIELEGTELEGI